ncbi:MAG TPA: hypothetical protein VJJ21_05195 [Candidatus Nanoarchaeia archaeon]|nr:hypothetical protein [Candidatus Nanoarchaeia archaeon]
MLQEHSQIADLLKKAQQHFNTADHIAYVTFPLVKDQKLIISVLDNLNQALICSVDSLMNYERLYKRIGLFSDNFDVKMQIFKTKIAPQYNLDRHHIVAIEEINQLAKERKSSTMEFAKRDKYVFCNQDYSKIKAIDMDKLKSYINQLKPFMRKLEIILQNVRRK